MNRSIFLLSATLAASLLGCGMLWRENAAMKRLLKEQGPLKSSAGPAVRDQGNAFAAPQPPLQVSGSQRSRLIPPESTAPEKGVPGAPPPGPPVLRRRPEGAFELSFGGGAPAAPVTPEDVLRIYGEMKSELTQEAVKRPGGPSWSPGQAAGASDTPEAGDRATAWAPREQDAGREWLHLKYPAETELAEITVHESFNPGSLSKVSAVMPDGSSA